MGEFAKLLPAAALLLVVGSIAPVEAQQTEAEITPDLAQEVAGMNRSLVRVAEMLEQLLEQQKTDIVLKRIEMRERRIAPLEGELFRRMGELETSKAELDRLETLKQTWEDRLREKARTDENAAAELGAMQSEFEGAFVTQSARQQGLEKMVRQLEDDLAEGRRSIRDLEELLLERIGQ